MKLKKICPHAIAILSHSSIGIYIFFAVRKAPEWAEIKCQNPHSIKLWAIYASLRLLYCGKAQSSDSKSKVELPRSYANGNPQITWLRLCWDGQFWFFFLSFLSFLLISDIHLRMHAVRQSSWDKDQRFVDILFSSSFCLIIVISQLTFFVHICIVVELTAREPLWYSMSCTIIWHCLFCFISLLLHPHPHFILVCLLSLNINIYFLRLRECDIVTAVAGTDRL